MVKEIKRDYYLEQLIKREGLGPKLGCGLITTATNWLYSIQN